MPGFGVARVADFRGLVQKPGDGLTQSTRSHRLAGDLVRFDQVEIAPVPHPISLSVDEGEAVALVDAEGHAGSRLVDLLSRASPPREGRIHLFGRDLSHAQPAERPVLRRRLGVMFRDLRLADDLDAFDNLALAARAVGRRPGDYAEPAQSVLAWVGLADHPDEPAGDMNIEARRRLALARAVVNRPDVFIADEPTADLTGEPRRSLFKLIADLHAAGTAILLITRDEDLATRSGAVVVRLASSVRLQDAADPA